VAVSVVVNWIPLNRGTGVGLQDPQAAPDRLTSHCRVYSYRYSSRKSMGMRKLYPHLTWVWRVPLSGWVLASLVHAGLISQLQRESCKWGKALARTLVRLPLRRLPCAASRQPLFASYRTHDAASPPRPVSPFPTLIFERRLIPPSPCPRFLATNVPPSCPWISEWSSNGR
jgi:hypothetical protein